jgi:TolB protein
VVAGRQIPDLCRRPPRAGRDGGETKLTSSAGRSDGPEFTPDGKHIYYNSTRTADPTKAGPTMQLWRMSPDGSNPEQVTNDEFNNWFPHISPDGKLIAFISFPKDVAPEDHPYYRECYLRLMPVAGGPAKVIAYIYGGQGTINVPSWAPDSKKLAFVTNSDIP